MHINATLQLSFVHLFNLHSHNNQNYKPKATTLIHFCYRYSNFYSLHARKAPIHHPLNLQIHFHITAWINYPRLHLLSHFIPGGYYSALILHRKCIPFCRNIWSYCWNWINWWKLRLQWNKLFFAHFHLRWEIDSKIHAFFIKFHLRLHYLLTL